MRCFYLDPGLRNDVGHHGNFCRYITTAFRRKGIETLVFGHRDVIETLAAECDARGHFQTFTYRFSDGDPIAGWLNGFDAGVQSTLEDLQRLPPVHASDLVYLSTTWPAQLLALLRWYRSLPEPQRPCLIFEVSQGGLSGRRQGEAIHLELPDPREDPRATLYRHIASRHMQPLPLPPRVYFISFDAAMAMAFNQLTGCAITTMPLPYKATGPLRNRAGAVPITLANLGHQRRTKGYQLMPDIVRSLLRGHRNIRILIQTVGGDKDVTRPVTDDLQAMAAADPRLILDDRSTDGSQWATLLARADLMLCPYLPATYTTEFSSLACEALTNAIPVIVPAGTTLETLLDACGGPGVAFAATEAPEILAAINSVLGRFDDYAHKAYLAALAWSETRGPDRLVERLVALAA